MSENGKQLKPGWKRYRFDEIAVNVNERIDNPAEAGVEYYVGLEHLDSDSLKIRRWGEPGDVAATKLRFQPGDIIFGRRRAYQRKLGVAEFEGICSAHAMVLRAKPETVLPEFLPFFLQTDLFMNRAVEISVGSLSPTINWKTLAVQEFALPPIDEQTRIVEVLSSLELLINELWDSSFKSQKLKSSMLLSSFSGFRDSTKYQITEFGKVAAILDPNPSHRYPKYNEDGIPLLATQDFVGDDDYRFDICKRIPFQTYKEQDSRCNFQRDDVIFARKGVLGLSRYYGEEKKAFSHTVVVIKPKTDEILPSYILWLTRSPSFMQALLQGMNSNSGVPTLGIKTMENTKILLPPRQKQQEVVETLESIQAAHKGIDMRRHQATSIKNGLLNQLFEKL